MKKNLVLIILLVSVVFLVIPWALWSYLNAPPSGKKEGREVVIPLGTSFTQVSRILEDHGVIAGANRFRVLARLRGVETKIKAGNYYFHTSMTPADVLDKLIRGENREYSITIPEGFTVFQIAELLHKEGLVEKQKLLERASDPFFVRSLGIQGDSLEGFLFPDTYLLVKGMGEERILKKMVARFNEKFNEQYRERAQELNLSREEVVTLASIVEKEAAYPYERPLIAAVFHNRLARGMMLQSDPTVIYGLKDFNGNLTRKDLGTESPFNTYLISGMPPQPISNPGEDSIRAVLFPSPSNYLYFVSRNDGTHYFSATNDEHNHAVGEYQKKRKTR